MVDHDVVGLYIAVHYAVGVAVVERLQELGDVIPNVIVGKGGVEDLEVCVVDVLKDEGRGLGLDVESRSRWSTVVCPSAVYGVLCLHDF